MKTGYIVGRGVTSLGNYFVSKWIPLRAISNAFFVGMKILLKIGMKILLWG
jgi:ABC-type uncharacterized transport system permease subunit